MKVVGLSFVLFAPLAYGQSFHLTDLGSWSSNMSAYDLNDNGEIVGSMSNDHAFRYSNGVVQDLKDFGIYPGAARGVNNAGKITGYVQESSSLRGFILSDAGVEWLDNEDGEYVPQAINNLGQVVGSYRPKDNPGFAQPFIYSNGQAQIFDIGSSNHNRAWDVNESGQFVGDADGRPFFYDGISWTYIGPITIHQGAAFAVNDLGQTVGYWYDRTAGHSHAFLYSNGVFADLGSFSRKDATAYDINNLGWVVGETAYISTGARGFLYRNSTMLDINSLVDASGVGYVIQSAHSINERNQIMASAILPSGEHRTVLLTPNQPVPEPGSVVVFGLGLSALLRHRPSKRSETCHRA